MSFLCFVFMVCVMGVFDSCLFEFRKGVLFLCMMLWLCVEDVEGVFVFVCLFGVGVLLSSGMLLRIMVLGLVDVCGYVLFLMGGLLSVFMSGGLLSIFLWFDIVLFSVEWGWRWCDLFVCIFFVGKLDGVC